MTAQIQNCISFAETPKPAKIITNDKEISNRKRGQTSTTFQKGSMKYKTKIRRKARLERPLGYFKQ